MSLFVKIFLWFWLATALVIGAFWLVNWATSPDTGRRQWQDVVSESVSIHAQTAAQIYENEGDAGLREFLQRINQSERIINSGFFVDGNLLAGDVAPETAREIVEKSTAGSVEFQDLPNEVLIAKRELLDSGKFGTLVVAWQRPRFTAPIDWSAVTLRILSVIFMAGLVCYALTRYLVSPIVKLRRATQKLSGGDLTIRIETKRRDELGSLARDFDEMAERIESLIGSQKRLTRDVSHELRSPLARLNVALELAKQKSNRGEQPLLNRIETESKRLGEMISQILTLSKLESRAEKIEKRNINLKNMVEQVAADANFEAENNGKKVNILELSECRVYGNENLLRSAIENVLRNAVRYTRENGAVEVSLKKNANQSVVTIKDQGAGVPENELKEMFRPFYRIGEARERKTGGIGLGLAITEKAILENGGEISARNSTNGGGLIVEIKLDCA